MLEVRHCLAVEQEPEIELHLSHLLFAAGLHGTLDAFVEARLLRLQFIDVLVEGAVAFQLEVLPEMIFTIIKKRLSLIIEAGVPVELVEPHIEEEARQQVAIVVPLSVVTFTAKRSSRLPFGFLKPCRYCFITIPLLLATATFSCFNLLTITFPPLYF